MANVMSLFCRFLEVPFFPIHLTVALLNSFLYYFFLFVFIRLCLLCKCLSKCFFPCGLKPPFQSHYLLFIPLSLFKSVVCAIFFYICVSLYLCFYFFYIFNIFFHDHFSWRVGWKKLKMIKHLKWMHVKRRWHFYKNQIETF